MGNSKQTNTQNSNPQPGERVGKKRIEVGHRLVAMRADQVDEIARAEGRGDNANVKDKRERCPWCFLKGGELGKHGCIRRTRRNKDSPPVGARIRRIPEYAWVE